MSYTNKVIEYFNSQDRREQEDLANQIVSGAYDEELKDLPEFMVQDLIEDLLSNNDLTPQQLESLKKINHIGAFIVLAWSEK